MKNQEQDTITEPDVILNLGLCFTKEDYIIKIENNGANVKIQAECLCIIKDKMTWIDRIKLSMYFHGLIKKYLKNK